jgi:hypothetical protein
MPILPRYPWGLKRENASGAKHTTASIVHHVATAKFVPVVTEYGGSVACNVDWLACLMARLILRSAQTACRRSEFQGLRIHSRIDRLDDLQDQLFS